MRDRWDWRPAPPLGHATPVHVRPVTLGNGDPAILKTVTPGRGCELEAAALRAFDGRGIVRLLDADLDNGLILLERIDPGLPMRYVADEDAAIAAASHVMRALRATPPAPSFPTTSDWAGGLAFLRARFHGGTGPLPAALVDAAERVFDDLHASASERVLLHGDLHHDNILSATRASWLAIDPKGVVGEPAYEPGALLRNPLPDLLRSPNPRRLLGRRIDGLSEALDLDRRRVAAYAFAQAVLAAWWQFEDEGAGWAPLVDCAELLREW